jgi:predicted MFS family arabinose efflux permease
MRFMDINRGDDRDFTLFMLTGFLGGVSSGIYYSIFNNFLNDTYGLTATGRGIVEIPRELPGLLIVIVLASLSFLGDVKVARIGMAFSCLGMLGLGLLSPTFPLMIVFLMVFSVGMHLFVPLAPSIAMGLSRKEEFGSRLGKYSAVCLLSTILGYALVWSGFLYFRFTYTTAFLLAAAFYLLAAVALTSMKKTVPNHTKFKLIFRRKYLLYYLLCIVHGARKQVFLTFAPWVLIQSFGLAPPTFAVLGVVIAGISILARTLIGKGIDTRGERFVLSLEAGILFVLCIGYAFAADIFSAAVAMGIIVVCYVLDSSISTVEMARSTYLRKIAVEATDVTHTLATGTSLDHILSLSTPVMGGLLWVAFGYKFVFIIAAFIALTNLFLARRIRVTE